MDGTDFWVDLKSELSGYEEQLRASIVLQIRKEQPPEVLEKMEQISELALQMRMEGKPEEEVELAVTAAMGPAESFVVSEINRRTGDFDLEHYILSWSSTVVPKSANYQLLSMEVRGWLTNQINAHRNGSAPQPGDLSRPPLSDGGEVEAGNSKASLETPSGEPETPPISPPTTSATDA